MPNFTIERTYDVPHYRHETYEAPDLETALKIDAANTEWEGQQADYETTRPERVTGAWAGERAYHGDSLLRRGETGDGIVTRDLGLAIRDFLEGCDIHHFEDDSDKGPADRVEVVDCSDANNLEVCMTGGRKFIVRIIASA